MEIIKKFHFVTGNRNVQLKDSFRGMTALKMRISYQHVE